MGQTRQGRTRAARLAAGLGAVTAATVLAWTLGVSGHCQIPCGIYNDPVRFTLLAEHAATIEKSMKQIAELSKHPGEHANQLVRWVANKEHHADEFAGIVTYYFLQQRIKPAAGPGKPGWDGYVRKLTLCHGMLVEAMKCKQTTDLAHVQRLRALLADFQKAYAPGK